MWYFVWLKNVVIWSLNSQEDALKDVQNVLVNSWEISWYVCVWKSEDWIYNIYDSNDVYYSWNTIEQLLKQIPEWENMPYILEQTFCNI